MSEYFFGLTKGKLPAHEVAHRDRICREEGGDGFTQIDDPGQGWIGWFTGPNLGDPFDRQLRARVLARIEREEDAR